MEKEDAANAAKNDGKAEKKDDAAEKKSSADSGKIVNLMAGKSLGDFEMCADELFPL